MVSGGLPLVAQENSADFQPSQLFRDPISEGHPQENNPNSRLDPFNVNPVSGDKNGSANTSDINSQPFHMVCKLCYEYFSDRTAYETHVKQVHQLDIVAFCPECDKTFKSWSGYTMHVKMHEGSNFKCHHCGKCFQSRAHVQIHMRSHSTVKPFVCLTCGKRYKHKKDLNTHVGSCLKTTVS